MNVTLEKMERQNNRQPQLWLVRSGPVAVGMIEKWPDTRADKHPHKAFLGTGAAMRYLGSFYPADGGRQAAVNHILGARKED